MWLWMVAPVRMCISLVRDCTKCYNNKKKITSSSLSTFWHKMWKIQTFYLQTLFDFNQTLPISVFHFSRIIYFASFFFVAKWNHQRVPRWPSFLFYPPNKTWRNNFKIFFEKAEKKMTEHEVLCSRFRSHEAKFIMVKTQNSSSSLNS